MAKGASEDRLALLSIDDWVGWRKTAMRGRLKST